MAAKMVAVVVVVVAAAMAVVMKGVDAAAFTVGDDNGWIAPATPDVYTTWAAGKTFSVGDKIVFNFAPGTHTVATTTSKDSYDNCDPKGAKVITVGPTEVTLDQTGELYFFCTIASHCASGQKFAINVVGASAPGPASAAGPASGPAADSPNSVSATDTKSPPKGNSAHVMGLNMSTLFVSFVALVATLLH